MWHAIQFKQEIGYGNKIPDKINRASKTPLKIFQKRMKKKYFEKNIPIQN